MLVFALLIATIWCYKSWSYKKSTYYKVTRNTFLSSLIDKGIRGEYLIYEKLSYLERDGAQFLFNLYIPNSKGGTTELDVVLIAKTGVYVFESKNYSGWIFGSEDQTFWTQTLPSGKNSQKERFYNPIKQNHSHIKNLRSIIGESVPVHSVVVFSERCELKNVSVHSPDITVVKRYYVGRAVKDIENRCGNFCLDNANIESLYGQLYPYTQVSTAVKEQHINSINKDAISMRKKTQILKNDNIEGYKLCPQCGAPLVLRTAKKGVNSGKQFYGCSGYPSCRFIKDL